MTEKIIRYHSLTLVIFIMAAAYCSPLLLILINALQAETPGQPHRTASPVFSIFNHFVTAWKNMNFPAAFFNTVIITSASIAGIIIMGAMAAYALQRIRFKGSRFFYFLFLSALTVPFQSFMIPLVLLTRKLGLNGSTGLIPVYWSLGCPLAVFLLQGFISRIPQSLEEAALLEGAGLIHIFFKIIVPLLKPAIAVILILDVYWIWNDFLLPWILLPPGQATLQLSQYKFFTQFRTAYGPAAASLVLSSLPVIILSLLVRKELAGSLGAAAVKNKIS